MSLVFATQLTAVATLALAVFAFITAILAYAAWRKQSSEVSDQAEMLRVQAKQLEIQRGELEREQAERRRAQAAQVFMWSTWADSKPVYHVRNTSQQPVYHLYLEWARTEPHAAGFERDWRNEPLMPGEEYTCSGLIDVISAPASTSRITSALKTELRPSEQSISPPSCYLAITVYRSTHSRFLDVPS